MRVKAMTRNLIIPLDIPANKSGDVKARLNKVYQNGTHKLVSADGTELNISDHVFKVLEQIIPHLERGIRTVTISPNNAEMTTQEAADILNVSRPYLIKLLESGEIPHTKTGSHRRIKVKDVMAYKDKKESQRSQALRELTDIMQEYGLFD
jgi:excisionase family DNA binding protein